MAVLHFPPGFLWGVATSAQQIEGAHDQGGRGESVWDRYASTPENIEDRSTPFRACDHYHRWPEDLRLLGELGVGAYRFSTSWSRIMPDGRTVNQAGLDFYEALVDALLAAGIQPCLTLNHWDMPQAFMDEHGGWAGRETVQRFVDYAAATAHRLGDRVRHWTTHNEPWCVAHLGYEQGRHAPGLRDPNAALRAAHHLLLSHGRATAALRGTVHQPEVGIVLNLSPAHPASDSEADVEAARQFDGFFNRWYLDALFRGQYPDDAVADRVARGHLADDVMPFVQPGDMDDIAAPMDWLGVNYYSRTVLAADSEGRPDAAPPVPADQLTEMGWEVYPDGLEEILRRVDREYGPLPLYVTENGAAFVDRPAVDGRIADPRRVSYFREHLAAVHRAVTAGVSLQGYFAWSLLDNFEWGHGYTKRFGLYGVDFETGERMPKDSALLYRDIVGSNAVDDGR